MTKRYPHDPRTFSQTLACERNLRREARDQEQYIDGLQKRLATALVMLAGHEGVRREITDIIFDDDPTCHQQIGAIIERLNQLEDYLENLDG